VTAPARDAPFRWLGHASLRLPGPPAVAVDPWRWRLPKQPVDVVLVTHVHADHCSEDDALAASHDGTVFAGPPAVTRRLARVVGQTRVTPLREGDRLERPGLCVTALPMEGPRREGRECGFHPRGSGLSYLVEVGGHSYLALGDSTALPEHEGLAPDVAFFPVGGLVVMDADEAAQAAARIRPRLAVPVHWGDLNARYETAAGFIAACAARGLRAALEPSPGS
jgi:L-ascorbate metabolism protein UlaG (beta-lactamase superfamily)